jgi:hypothetical protein
MTERNEFSVYQFFKDNSYEKVRSFVSAEEAVTAFNHYTTNVASRIGITARVIVTDGGDSIVFEWKSGLGITFRPRDDPSKLGSSQEESSNDL